MNSIIFKIQQQQRTNPTANFVSNTPSPYGGVPFRQFPISIPRPVTTTLTPPPPANVYNETMKDEMTWGKPTWFLFHTLAEKAFDTHFTELRTGLLDTIYTICVNLPCPKCAEHAKKHLNGINFNTITTKEYLKRMMFDFHNYVNQQKKYRVFQEDELEMYTLSITRQIIYNFFIEFTKKTKNIRYLADDLHRERVASSLKRWFSNNIQYFAD